MDLGVRLRDQLPRVEKVARRIFDFALRHKWSLPLALVSSASLFHLASEMREGELAEPDAAIAAFVGAWRGQLDSPMLVLTTIGDWTSLTVFTALLVIALLAFGRRREAVFMSTGTAGTLALSSILKLIFQRDRPEMRYLIPSPSSFSFPSGHAMGSMGVFATSLVILHVVGAPRPVRLAAIVAVALVVSGVALSRVYFGVHFASDVLGGQLAAAAWVSALTGWFYPRLLPGEEATVAEPGRD